MKLSSMVAAAFSGGSIAPSTLNIASATAASYVRQTKSLTINPTAVTLRSVFSYLVLTITGTDAFINSGDFAQANTWQVSIDGANFVNCPKVSTGKYALFQGQPQATRSVIVRTGITSIVWSNTSTNVISVTGAPPNVVASTNHSYCYDGVTKSSIYTFANPNGAGYTPVNMPRSIGATTGNSRSPMMCFRSSTTYLDILSCQSYVFVSVDEQAPTVYNLVSATASSDGRARRLQITGLSGTHNYYIWTDPGVGATTQYPILDVGTSDVTVPLLVDKGRVDCYGASQTAGGNYFGITNAHTAIYRVAAMMGRVASGIGGAGANITTLEPLITGDWSSNKTIDPLKDYAVIQATTNDGNVTYSAAKITSYNNIITNLLTKYKGVRIITPYPTFASDAATSGNVYPLAAASLKSIVDAIKHPTTGTNPSADLILIDSGGTLTPSDWIIGGAAWTSPKLIGSDGLHLGSAGDNTGNERLAAYYAAALAPTLTT